MITTSYIIQKNVTTYGEIKTSQLDTTTQVLPLFSTPMKDIPGEYKEKATSICGISIYM